MSWNRVVGCSNLRGGSLEPFVTANRHHAHHPLHRAFATAALCQPPPLTTTFASNNGQSGNMFDVGATSAAGVTIKNFEVNLDAGTWDLEVYVSNTGGTHIGNEQNSAAWNLVGTAAGIVSAGVNGPTLLPICVEEYIPAGSTQGFYVTVTNGTAINYTTGTGFLQGDLYASNADIEFFAGTGNVYPFGAIFGPPSASRIWSGNIFYDLGDTTGAGCTFASVAPTASAAAATRRARPSTSCTRRST